MDKIQKVISRAGYYSRREAERLIKEGKIKVNHEIAHIGQLVSEQDDIYIMGKKIKKTNPYVYYLLNKPRGCVSTTKDQKGRKTVIDFVPNNPKVYPVGRLDYNTTGALLLTNDGDLALKLTHPKFKKEKKYIVIFKGKLSTEDIKELKLGVQIKSGYRTAPAKVRVISYDKERNQSKISLTITEGKKHQVKMMLKTRGYLVDKLHREQFSIFTVKGIAPGKYVKIDNKDIEQLK